jgi:hypothetical protein
VKVESVAEYLKRGGKISKVPTQPEEPQSTVDYTDKAQPSFYETPVDGIILEGLGLPLKNEVDSDSEDE